MMGKNKDTKQSLEKREIEAKRYIKASILKQVGKQKLFELGIIPTFLAFIWYVPYWAGLLAVKVIGHDNYLIFTNTINGNIIQDALTRGDFWTVGFFAIVIVAGFFIVNISIAISKLKDRARNKFNISWCDLSDFSLRGDYK